MNAAFLKFIIFGFLLSLTNVSLAQRRQIRKANAAYELEQYQIAIKKYRKASKKLSKKRKRKKPKYKIIRPVIAYKLAECYRMTSKIPLAKSTYKRAIRLNYYETDPIVYLRYGNMLRMYEDYEEAIVQYEIYLDSIPNDTLALNGLASCKLAVEYKENPTNYQIDNPRKINSKYDDFAPAYADKFYNAIVFSSSREESTGKEKDIYWTDADYSDLFVVKKDREGKWNKPRLLDESENINTKSHEGAATFNDNYSQIYFTRCLSGDEEGEENNENPEIGCKILVAKRAGKNFSAPKIIELGKETAVFGHPSVNSDGTVLYFVSDMSGGYGGKDIWVARRESMGEDFGIPVNLGPTINTAADEVFPLIRNDTILYFSSDGHPGIGGLDIFKSIKITDSSWSVPQNMKIPLNSSRDDFGITFHKEDEQGYFTSNRKKGRGKDDIYTFIDPPVVFSLKGIVKDDRTLQYIKEAKVFLSGSDQSKVYVKTDEKGFYSFSKSQIKPETTYELLVEMEGYLNNKIELSTIDVGRSTDFEENIAMQPVPVEAVVLPDILFDLAKWDLKDQYKDSLQGLIRTLDANEGIIVELAAHTDARGSEEANDVLSQKRAESVVNYIIERGIHHDRLVAKGYGERQFRKLQNDVNKNGFQFAKGTLLTEDYIESLSTNNQREVAHELNRRIEFKILSRDFAVTKKIDTSEFTKIEMITSEEENLISYREADDKYGIVAKCRVNGFAVPFTYIAKDRHIYMSEEQALYLLISGAIDKTDFKGDSDKIIGDGEIKNRTILTIKEIRIGRKTLNNVEVMVIRKQKNPLQFGAKILTKFGNYTIDKDKQQISFK